MRSRIARQFSGHSTESTIEYRWCLHIETRFHYAAERGARCALQMLTIEEACGVNSRSDHTFARAPSLLVFDTDFRPFRKESSAVYILLTRSRDHLSGYNDHTMSSYEYRGCPVGSRDWLMGVSYYCVYDRVTSLLLSTIHPVKAGINLFHSSILRS